MSAPPHPDLAFYAQIAPFYDFFYDFVGHGGRTVAEIDFLAWQLGEHDPAQTRVLDLACGTGRHLVEMARRGYRVEGVDMSPDMLGVARSKLEAAGLHVPTHIANMLALPASLTGFDVATCFLSAIAHMLTDADLDQALRSIIGTLKPGGLFIVDTANCTWLLDRFRPTIEELVPTPDGFIQRTTLHHIDSVRSVLGHEEFILVASGDQVQGHHFKTDLRMMSFPELEGHLQRAGFVDCCLYGEATDREPAAIAAHRLLVASRKPA